MKNDLKQLCRKTTERVTQNFDTHKSIQLDLFEWKKEIKKEKERIQVMS